MFVIHLGLCARHVTDHVTMVARQARPGPAWPPPASSLPCEGGGEGAGYGDRASFPRASSCRPRPSRCVREVSDDVDDAAVVLVL